MLSIRFRIGVDENLQNLHSRGSVIFNGEGNSASLSMKFHSKPRSHLRFTINRVIKPVGNCEEACISSM